MDKAIIGGTGVYDVAGSSYTRTVETGYGMVPVDIVEMDGQEIAFLARHGKDHGVPPHLINYRANIKALAMLGIKYIYATVAVGSCNEQYAPGDVVMIRDFLDFTKVRPVTFFEGGPEGVIHTDMSDPYCRNLRGRFLRVAGEMGIEVKGEGVYVCTEGPRFETKSEINLYKTLGGDVVGMTNVPEVVLAKELGMCYSAVGIITNWCTGISGEAIALHDIQGAMNRNKEKITKAFIRIFSGDLQQNECKCSHSTIKL
jgi:5'-methylthioadenosine phosphorylase